MLTTIFKIIDLFESELRYDVECEEHWYELEYNHPNRAVQLTLCESYGYPFPNREVIHEFKSVLISSYANLAVELYGMRNIQCWERFLKLLHLKEVRL